MMTKKTIYKITSIFVLLGGLALIVFALIALFKDDTTQSMIFSVVAAPLMFGGVFLFTLGFGKDGHAKR